MEKIALSVKTGVRIDQKVYPSFSVPADKKNQIIRGWKFRVAGFLSGLHVVWLSLKRFRYPWKAFHYVKALSHRRKAYRNTHQKIVKGNNKYYTNLYSPGWPSKAFDRYIHHSLDVFFPETKFSLFALAFAITNKCGFQCEHCVEWEQLNRKDSLSAGDLVTIIKRFQQLGISQVQLSGGEPGNRFEEILYILDAIPEGIDFWMYTNGYNLSAEKTAMLKAHGLTGVLISLDHYDPEEHDRFRGVKGSWERALQSATHVVDSGLLLAFSCCATNDFISINNLDQYAKVCRNTGAAFIQLLEPEAAGRYKQKNVSLTPKNRKTLERFFELLNFDEAYSDYPIASYPALIKRMNGCTGSGLHFLYLDADGYVHACPFCKKQLFHALDPGLENKGRLLRKRGCSLAEVGQANRGAGKREQAVPATMTLEEVTA